MNGAFGWSVSINSPGRMIAIGAPGERGFGRVHVYKFNELRNEWQPYGEALLGDQLGGEFGNSTNISENGDHLVIGARNYDEGRGRVSVHHFSKGAWVQRGSPISGLSPNDNLGNSVSISSNGKRIAVGAARENVAGIGEDVGVVRVFEFKEALGLWAPLGPPIHGEQAYEKFGFSVKLASTGDVVAIGAPFRHKRVNNQGDFEWGGAIIVFSFDIEKDEWIPMGQPIGYTNAVERSGWSVDLSVSGSIIAVGCPVNDENGEASGQVRVYEFNSNPEVRDWEQKGNSIQGQDLGSWFGNTVSLSSDGNKVAAALWCDRPGLEPCDFGVRMFNYDFGERTWNQLGTDLPGKTRYDPYSTSVAMAKDDTILMTSVDLESGKTVVQTYKPKTS